MNRIGQDYIGVRQPVRQTTPWHWLGISLTVAAVATAIGLIAPSSVAIDSEATTESSSNRDTVIIDAPAMEMEHAPVAGAPASAEPVRVALAMPKPTSEPLDVSPALAMPASAGSMFNTEIFAPANLEPAPAMPRWSSIEIQRGDTLSLAFQRHDLSYGDSLAIANLDEFGRHFTRGLKAGDTLRVQADPKGVVHAVDYPLDKIRTLEVRRVDNGFDARIDTADVERREAYAVGSIDTSFYVDALEAGLSDQLIMKLAHIFGWDIDFVLDIRQGDRFTVIYEELFRDGEKIGTGAILAAEFNNRGRQLKALRFTAADGESDYYAPDGKAMRKAFIRTPLDQFRISSHFSTGRKHPILHKIRAHHGTDYAAPTGTPVRATGNGRVAFRGTKGGYGNTIIVKHSNQYTTRYAHLSRFASGVGIGSRVRQGQTIGYVGMSGLATGPHLHYEFRVYGTPKDPMRVTLPTAEPLPEKHMAAFKKHAEPLVAQLDSLGQVQIADNRDGD